MPAEVLMVTSCPLCLAPDEVESMVTVEIERAVPRARAAILICRNCTGAVIRAIRKLEPPLLTPQFWIDEVKADQQSAAEAAEAQQAWNRSVGATETQAESAQLHEGEEPDDA